MNCKRIECRRCGMVVKQPCRCRGKHQTDEIASCTECVRLSEEQAQRLKTMRAAGRNCYVSVLA